LRQRAGEHDEHREPERRAEQPQRLELREAQCGEGDDDCERRGADRLADPPDRGRDRAAVVFTAAQVFAVTEHEEHDVVGPDTEQHDRQQVLGRLVDLEVPDVRGDGEQHVDHCADDIHERDRADRDDDAAEQEH
jgi:hypothetical protein